MAEGLNLAGEAKTDGVDVTQELEGKRHVLLQRRLDFLHVGIAANQIEHAHDLAMARVDSVAHRHTVEEEPAGRT